MMKHIITILSAFFCALTMSAQEVPSYFFEDGYLDSRIKSVPKGSSFIFITDTHFPRSTRTSTPVIRYVMDRLDIDHVVFGGDVVDWNPTKEEAAAVVKEYFDELYAVAGKNLIWVHGNHDCNSAAVTKYKYPEETSLIPDTEVYEMTVARYADQVVFDEELIEKYRNDQKLSDWQKEQALAYLRMHYYRDNAKDKIRYIIFDTIDNGPTTRHTIRGKRVLTTQLPFIRKAMETAPKGWTIVLLAHTMGHHKYGIKAGDFHAPLYHEVASFRKRTGRKVILIGGHQHVDAALTVTSDGHNLVNKEPDSGAVIGRDEVLTVWVNRDAYKARMAKWAAGGRDCELKKSVSPKMVKGTKDEVSFDIVTITKKGKVVFTRIGAGEDRNFRFAKK